MRACVCVCLRLHLCQTACGQNPNISSASVLVCLCNRKKSVSVLITLVFPFLKKLFFKRKEEHTTVRESALITSFTTCFSIEIWFITSCQLCVHTYTRTHSSAQALRRVSGETAVFLLSNSAICLTIEPPRSDSDCASVVQKHGLRWVKGAAVVTDKQTNTTWFRFPVTAQIVSAYNLILLIWFVFFYVFGHS